MGRWVFSAIILLNITLLLATPSVHASSGQAYEVGADILNVRDKPDHDAKIIGQLEFGDHLNVFQEKYGWVQTYFDGKEAWVASQFLVKGQQTNSKRVPQIQTDTKGSLNGHTIMLDPGHGGKDPGAISMNGEKEKDLTLSLASAVAQKLRNAGATVLLTRSDDTSISLGDRVRMSNSYQTDAFISLHYNAYVSNESNGISTHYYSNGEDLKLAQQIQQALDKHTILKNRGIKNDAFHVLKKNKDLSVLVELGFITNPTDQAAILSDNHPENVANAITEGLIHYFNQ
jgi:N-acetylmuramoyl-L-alanine amidase